MIWTAFLGASDLRLHLTHRVFCGWSMPLIRRVITDRFIEEALIAFYCERKFCCTTSRPAL